MSKQRGKTTGDIAHLASFLAQGMCNGEAYYHWKEPEHVNDVPWNKLSKKKRYNLHAMQAHTLKNHQEVYVLIDKIKEDAIRGTDDLVRLAKDWIRIVMEDGNIR